MEKSDQELLLQIANVDPSVKRLYEEHVKLDKECERVSRFAAYSSTAALHHKELKKLKLKGMDAILTILNEHRIH